MRQRCRIKSKPFWSIFRRTEPNIKTCESKLSFFILSTINWKWEKEREMCCPLKVNDLHTCSLPGNTIHGELSDRQEIRNDGWGVNSLFYSQKKDVIKVIIQIFTCIYMCVFVWGVHFHRSLSTITHCVLWPFAIFRMNCTSQIPEVEGNNKYLIVKWLR